MIQFNLLPDVKQEYVKARRLKHMVTLIALAVCAGSLFLLALMLVTVDGVQKKSMHDLDKDITKYSTQLKSVNDLDKMLTVQNQLNTLTSLHDKKVVTSRLFGYLAQLTPTQAGIGKLTVDFNENTMSIAGSAPSFDSVNAFTDTLKSTTYKVDKDSGSGTKAFKDVVMASFARDKSQATYTITLSFDPVIFDSSSNVALTVPSGTTGPQSQLFNTKAGS